MQLSAHVRTVPHFPKPGIMFRDISPLLQNPEARKAAVRNLAGHWKPSSVTTIVGLDARGFIFGSMLAYEMDLPFVMVRKKGKLPGQTVDVSYGLEYGSDVFEMQADALPHGARVLVVDDLLATGGSAEAAAILVRKLGGTIAGFAFMIELADLGGAARLKPHGEIFSLLTYETEPARASA